MKSEIKTFDYWNGLFNANQLGEFNNDKSGLLWLKIKAINRKENKILQDFCDTYNYILKSNLLKDTAVELYELLSKDCDNGLHDAFRSNIKFLANDYKRSLALTMMNRSMTRKVTMGHFAHTQALVYANHAERVKRNRSLARPIKDIFKEMVPQYNNAVFDNGHENVSYNDDAINLLSQLKDVDLVYFDPPYCGSHPDYQGFYHLLETYTEYWKDKNFINGTHRYDPQRHSGFDKKNEVMDSFSRMFEAAQDIPYWIVSYNDRSFPSKDDFVKLLSDYRHVSVIERTYSNDYGGKGSVKGSKELLFLCNRDNIELVDNTLKKHSSILSYSTKSIGM